MRLQKMKLRCKFCNGGNRFNMHVHLAHNAFSRLALTLESQNSFSFQILRDLSLANKETLTVFAQKQMVQCKRWRVSRLQRFNAPSVC